MPILMDEDVAAFRNDTLVEYHEFVSAYAKSLDIESSICLMPHQLSGGINTNTTRVQKMMEIPIDRLCGMETVYTEFSEEQTALAKKIAEEFDLLESGGSDFHGSTKPDVAFGSGFGNLKVPASFAEIIIKRSEKK